MVEKLQTHDYPSLIQEAFIAPIRSVMVIDDEYPTFEKYLGHKLRSLTEKDDANFSAIKPEDLERLNSIYKLCRSPDRRWTVDVDDGRSSDPSGVSKYAQQLHQSDLLILDYHLDGQSDAERGDMALDIIRQLASNQHFNLVIIHTKAQARDTVQVLEDVVLSLLKNPLSDPLAAAQQLFVEKALDAWEVEVDRQIRDRIVESVPLLDLLRLLQDGNSPRKFSDSPALSELEHMYSGKPPDVMLPESLFIKWAVKKRVELVETCFSDTFYGKISWEVTGRWVCADNLFITVAGKATPADQLPAHLQDALTSWNPHPHRLLLAKMRHELDENGISIANQIIDNRYVQAGWLDELVSSSENGRATAVGNVLTRHWEQLASQTRSSLSTFGRRMADNLVDQGRDNVLATYRDAEVTAKLEEIKLHVNCYNCSKPVDGHHLATGHVLRIREGTADQFWLCLSPACDLVPDQKSSGWNKRLGQYMPVKAVQLYSAKTACRHVDDRPLTDDEANSRALKLASQNLMLFLSIQGEISAFSFTPTASSTANPNWEQFLAERQGLFEPDGKSLSMVRIRTDGNTNDLKFQPYKVEVVAQLRYEYALNLLQRLGVTLSRVGLDFLSHGGE